MIYSLVVHLAVGGVDDSRYMFISTSNFNVKQDGSVTGSQFLLEGGTISEDVSILGTVSLLILF